MNIIKKYWIGALPALLLALPGFAQTEFGSGFEAGVGVRALGLANNHVAIANDLSASYWNPAALALLPVREVQASFDMLRIGGESKITGRSITVPQGAENEDYLERIRFSGIGYMRSIPTTQGGLTLAFSFDRPFIFDDITVYEYLFDNLREYRIADGRKHDDLNRWTGSFGVQVTDKISAGLSFSLISGGQKITMEQVIDDYEVFEWYKGEYDYSYLGYTLTGGFLFYPDDMVKIGVRLSAPMDISFSEKRKDYIEWYDYYDGTLDVYNPRSTTNKGRAYTPPSGSLGVGVTFPWFIAALDLRLTMPYTFILPSENIPKNVQARYYKSGGGIGVEVPLPVAPVVLRAGYSLDEYDLFPIIHKFKGEPINWREAQAFEADGYKHSVSAGAAVFTSGVGFEVAYAYQTWGVKHTTGERVLNQSYDNHRFATSLIFRY